MFSLVQRSPWAARTFQSEAARRSLRSILLSFGQVRTLSLLSALSVSVSGFFSGADLH